MSLQIWLCMCIYQVSSVRFDLYFSSIWLCLLYLPTLNSYLPEIFIVGGWGSGILFCLIWKWSIKMCSSVAGDLGCERKAERNRKVRNLSLRRLADEIIASRSFSSFVWQHGCYVICCRTDALENTCHRFSSNGCVSMPVSVILLRSKSRHLVLSLKCRDGISSHHKSIIFVHSATDSLLL